MKEIILVSNPIAREVWEEHVKEGYGDMVKIVVDVKREIIGLGGNLHSDAERVLLDNGSRQEDVWGANIYPESNGFTIAYESLINIRPAQGNRSNTVLDNDLKLKMKSAIDKLLLI